MGMPQWSQCPGLGSPGYWVLGSQRKGTKPGIAGIAERERGEALTVIN